ncbi:MAG: hypothetical protein ACE5EZ_04625 [Thermodesulfobacteriota bacterium]
MFNDNKKKISSGYFQCPLCDAEVALGEDEKTGDQIYCSYCQCPLRVREKKENKYLVEDF